MDMTANRRGFLQAAGCWMESPKVQAFITLFIAVIVNAMQTLHEKEVEETSEEIRACRA